MFSLLISRPLRGLVAALDALGAYFTSLFAVVQEAHATAARFEELAQMSDTELADVYAYVKSIPESPAAKSIPLLSQLPQ